MAIGFSISKGTIDSTVAGLDVQLREWCERVDRLAD